MLKFFKNKKSKISTNALNTNVIELNNGSFDADMVNGSFDLYDDLYTNEATLNFKSIKYYSIDKNKYIETQVPSHMNILDNNNNNFISFDNVKETKNDNMKETKNDNVKETKNEIIKNKNDIVSNKIYSYIKTDNDILNEIYDYYLNDSCQKDKKFDYMDRYFSYDVMTGVYYYKSD